MPSRLSTAQRGRTMTIPFTPSENQLLARLMDRHTDKITIILGKIGVYVDLELSPEESCSEKTRKRAYLPRIQKAFRELPEDHRAQYFANLSVMLLEQTIVEGEPKTAGQNVTGETTGDQDDRRFARMAIEEARKSVPEDDTRPHPLVGAVVVKDGKVLATAHRGEAEGNHAEFTALEKKLAETAVAGATVYTTLEPCTTRNHPKIPCADRLIERKVRRVVIGMLDPDPRITGRGQRRLRQASIITDLFPHDLMTEVEELNREFTRHFETSGRITELTRQVVESKSVEAAAIERLNRHREINLPKLENIRNSGFVEIGCYPVQRVEIPVLNLKKFLQTGYMNFSEEMQHFSQIHVFQNGVSAGFYPRGIRPDSKSTVRLTLYKDGFAVFDALADTFLKGEKGLHAGWLSYEIQRQLQLVKELLREVGVVSVLLILRLKNIESSVLSVPSGSGLWLESSEYTGQHEPISRTINLSDIHEHDGEKRNIVMPVVADIMGEVYRIFGRSTVSGLWGEDGKLLYVKGLENQR